MVTVVVVGVTVVGSSSSSDSSSDSSSVSIISNTASYNGNNGSSAAVQLPVLLQPPGSEGITRWPTEGGIQRGLPPFRSVTLAMPPPHTLTHLLNHRVTVHIVVLTIINFILLVIIDVVD